MQDATRLLSYGAIGLAAILAILAFRLLSAEQKSKTIRTRMLRGIGLYIGFSLFLFCGGIYLDVNRSSKQEETRTLETLKVLRSVDGKILQSPLFGFSFVYPDSYVFEESTGGVVFLGGIRLDDRGSALSISVSQVERMLPIDIDEDKGVEKLADGIEIVLSANNGKISAKSFTQVLGKRALVIDFKQKHEPELSYRKVLIPVFSRKVIYEFTLSTIEENKSKHFDILNKAVSTFALIP